MSVRVIAGQAKGRRLRVPDVKGLRPTGDRARETLFNILAPRLRDCRFLDVFAGSGAVGIEALSRGAARAVFVERDRRAVECLANNLESCRLADRADVRRGAWRRELDRLGAAREKADIAFFDPPYDRTAASEYLQALEEAALLAAGGLVIVEHRSHDEMAAPEGWELERRVRVGDTSFTLFARSSESASEG